MFTKVCLQASQVQSSLLYSSLFLLKGTGADSAVRIALRAGTRHGVLLCRCVLLLFARSEEHSNLFSPSLSSLSSSFSISTSALLVPLEREREASWLPSTSKFNIETYQSEDSGQEERKRSLVSSSSCACVRACARACARASWST